MNNLFGTRFAIELSFIIDMRYWRVGMVKEDVDESEDTLRTSAVIVWAGPFCLQFTAYKEFEEDETS
jgi:hypothetical protein